MTSNVTRFPIAEPSISRAISSEGAMLDLGFEQDDFGQLYAIGCRVTLYRVGGEWEIDIVLPNGSAIGCDVALSALQGRARDDDPRPAA